MNLDVVLSSKESERGAREVGERGQDEIELEAVGGRGLNDIRRRAVILVL